MSIIDIKELSSIREEHKNKKIVFCSGTFDLTHAGHILFFEECKKYGDILVVNVGNDFNVRQHKGVDRPIFNEHVRLKIVSSLKPVDYAFLDVDAVDNDVLTILASIFKDLKPDIYVINQDALGIPRRRELMEGHAIKMVILERTCPPEFEQISSTKILEKIKEK